LVVSISGGTGDADLYVRQAGAPTTTSYDCRPYLNGNNETCTFQNPTPGTWYIGVRAYSAFSGVNLEACSNGVPARTAREGDGSSLEDFGAIFGGSNFTVYPNPVQDVLNLELNVAPAHGSFVTIYTLSGTEAMRIATDKIRGGIDVSALGEGMYLISIEDEKHNRVTQQFIKQ